MRNMKFMAMTLVLILIGITLGGCSRDPNVRKGKYYASGKRYFDREKYREAAIQLQNAIQIDPRYAEAHHLLAESYLKLGMLNGAYAELLRTVELAPRNSKARIDLGNILLVGRDPKKAMEQAQIVLSEDPNNADGHALTANAHALMGKLEDALKEIVEAVRLAPDRSQFYLNLAELQARARLAPAAEESYKKAAQLDSKSATPATALGIFYFQSRRFTEAEQQFRRAEELEPKAPQPRSMLARLYLAQGEKKKAEQVLEEAKKTLNDNSDGYRMLADYYLGSGDSEKATTEYASLYREHPKDLVVKKNYIQLLVLRNQLEEATKLNNEILKANDKDVEGLIIKGQIAIRQGHPGDAVPLLESALKAQADSASAHYFLGLAFSQTGNLERAESQWRTAARLQPNMVDAQRALAGVALRKGDVSELAASADALISAQPSSPLGYVYRAAASAARKDFPHADSDLHKAISVAPNSHIGYTRLANLRAFGQGRYEEAETLYEQALEHDPNALEALVGLVRIFTSRQQTQKALDRVNAQIARAPNNSAFYLVLGQLLVMTKDLEKAEAALQKATELNKNNIDAFLLLGQVQVARGSLERAIASCQRTIQENSRDVRAYLLLGSLEERRGEWQKAQEVYQKALQVEPDYPLAANNLAYLMLEHNGNTDVALSLAQVARRGMPDMPNAADTLAWAYYQKGQYASAIDLLNQALKKLPQNPTYHYHLGLAYQKTKDLTRSRLHFERVLQLDPKNSHADEIRKSLVELAGS